MHTQQAAEIAYFKLAAARSFRFHNIPTTRTLDLKTDQVLKVTDSRDIAYFRNRPDTVVETDPTGVPLNAPDPGTISTPNALSKRVWKQPGQAPQTVAGRPVPGTRVIGSPMPPAQNPTAGQAVSRYSQQSPAQILKGQRPGIVGHPGAITQGPVAAPMVHAVATPQPSGPLLEVRLGKVIHPPTVPAQAPQVHAAPAVQPAAPAQSPAPAPEAVHPGAPTISEASAPAAVEPVATPAPPAPPASAADSPPPAAPVQAEATQVQPEQPVAAATAAPAAPADVPMTAEGEIDPAYIAAPIPPGGIPQRPTVMSPGGQPAAVQSAVQYASADADASHSASVQAVFSGHRPSGDTAQQALAKAGLAGPVEETPIESVGNDGKPAGEF